VTTIRYGAFEWDDLKAITNAKKHGITFEEAVTVFFDPLVLVQPDTADDSRFLVLGRSSSARVLFVV
jgi:uncharacterized DUF497 family protein